MFTDRELASGILLLGSAVVLALVPSTRRALSPQLREVARLLTPKVVVPFLALFAWAALCVWGALVLHAWDVGLLKDTVLTVLLVGVPQVTLAATETRSGRDIVRRIRNETLGLGFVAVAYLNLVSFPLWVELILQPLAAVLAMLEVASRQQEAAGCLAPFFRAALALLGVSALTWTTIELVEQAGTYGWWSQFASVILTIWLPLALVPFLYVFAFIASTESALVRLTFHRARPARGVLPAVVLGLRFRVALAARFPGRHRDVVEAAGFRDAIRRMAAFREETERRAREEAYRLDLLERFTGVDGTDDEGLQRDRREFLGTKRVLEQVATLQSARHRNELGHYWDDEWDGAKYAIRWERHGLPADHGIKVETTRDQQTWRAYRRLPNGWYMGTGGTGQPHSEWFYSGPTPPSGWPGDGTLEWVNGATSMRQPDWEHDDSPRL